MADVKWIKIVTDIFDDDDIKLIRSMPNGDAYTLMWFELLCLAGKQNNNGVFEKKGVVYTPKMFATIFDRSEETVSAALRVFLDFGFLELIDGVYCIPNWEKHQSLDAYEKKKERDRGYQARARERQKAILQKSSDNRLTSNDLSSDDKTIIARQEKEEDKDKDIYISNALSVSHEENSLLNVTLSRTGAREESETFKQIPAKSESVFSLADLTEPYLTFYKNRLKDWCKRKKKDLPEETAAAWYQSDLKKYGKETIDRMISESAGARQRKTTKSELTSFDPQKFFDLAVAKTEREAKAK